MAYLALRVATEALRDQTILTQCPVCRNRRLKEELVKSFGTHSGTGIGYQISVSRRFGTAPPGESQAFDLLTLQQVEAPQTC